MVGPPVACGWSCSSKGELVVPDEKPGTPANATGAPARELNRLISWVSNGVKVSPCWPTNGLVNIVERPGFAGSAGW